MKTEPQAEHQWLQRFVGRWTFETVNDAGPDQPQHRSTGTEVVRPLGDLWVVCEGEGTTPDGELARSIITFGFDPVKGKYVNTFVSSMMAHLWICEGEREGDRLSLFATGPDFEQPGTSREYRDVFEFLSDDRRVLEASIRGEDGEWVSFMHADYRRME